MKEISDNVLLLNQDDRDWDDFYQINNSSIICFEFQISNDVQEIRTVHNYKQAQDLSLRFWISDKPNAASLFPDITSLHYSSLLREPKVFHFGPSDSSALYVLDPGTYFVMIQNLQNSPNYFNISFNY